MREEISVAERFLTQLLLDPEKPQLKIAALVDFGLTLRHILILKYENHWYPLSPYRESEYRCIRLGKGSSTTKSSEIDPVYIRTLSRCGITTEEFLNRMPENLTIWIDPGEVSYRIGEYGKVKTLYETVASNLYKRLDLNSSDSKNSK
jgi:protein Tob/BTG